MTADAKARSERSVLSTERYTHTVTFDTVACDVRHRTPFAILYISPRDRPVPATSEQRFADSIERGPLLWVLAWSLLNKLGDFGIRPDGLDENNLIGIEVHAVWLVQLFSALHEGI